MALGEYISVAGQHDAEVADIQKERDMQVGDSDFDWRECETKSHEQVLEELTCPITDVVMYCRAELCLLEVSQYLKC